MASKKQQPNPDNEHNNSNLGFKYRVHPTHSITIKVHRRFALARFTQRFPKVLLWQQSNYVNGYAHYVSLRISDDDPHQYIMLRKFENDEGTLHETNSK